jgi:hypothetical protein
LLGMEWIDLAHNENGAYKIYVENKKNAFTFKLPGNCVSVC